jgi:hypothetical protein
MNMKTIFAIILTILLMPVYTWAQAPPEKQPPQPKERSKSVPANRRRVYNRASAERDSLDNQVPFPGTRVANDSVLLQSESLKGLLVAEESSSRSAAPKIKADTLKAAIRAFFVTRYSNNTCKVLREESDDVGGAIEIAVEGVRAEITKQNLWEKFTIFTVFYVTSTGVKIHLVIDAKVAAGIRAPGDRDYDYLDKDYSERLQEYTKSLLTELARSWEN